MPWADRDDAFTNIVEGIERVIGEMLKSAAVPVAPPPNPPVQNVTSVAEPTNKSPLAPTFPVQWQEIKKNSVELLSAKGIVYRELEKLLKEEKWYEADQLTDLLMLKASGREDEGWLDLDNIKKFPCEDLQTIDRLWVFYSKGLYGFSVQKDIYVECGGRLDFICPSSGTWDQFCDRTAWKSDGDWVPYPQPFFENNFMYTKGHLPLVRMFKGKNGQEKLNFFFSSIKIYEV